jgi:N-acyl-D-aspartate/D-glutamate deacylase
VVAARHKADLVLFSPGRVCDRASYDHPHQLSEGIDTVVVNGVVTLDEGRVTGERGGVFID